MRNRVVLMSTVALLMLSSAAIGQPPDFGRERWEIDPASPTGAVIRDISLRDDVGVVAAGREVWLTADGGSQWEVVVPEDDLSISDVRWDLCVRKGSRIILSSKQSGGSIIAWTDNEGRDWDQGAIVWQQEPFEWKLEALTFADDSPQAVGVGWQSVTQGDEWSQLLLYTPDGGASWQQKQAPVFPGYPGSRDHLIGVAYAKGPPLLRAAPAGRQMPLWLTCSFWSTVAWSTNLQTWHEVDLSPAAPSYKLTMFDMPDSQLAWIVDSEQVLCFEGKDLIGIYPIQHDDLYMVEDIVFATETHGVAKSVYGPHMTVDGGQTWTSVQKVVTEPGQPISTSKVGAFTSGVSAFDAFRVGGKWSQQTDEGPNETGGVLLEYTGMPIFPRQPQPQIPGPIGN